MPLITSLFTFIYTNMAKKIPLDDIHSITVENIIVYIRPGINVQCPYPQFFDQDYSTDWSDLNYSAKLEHGR